MQIAEGDTIQVDGKVLEAVLSTKDLTDMQKILYIDIQYLIKDGHCSISNSFLAERHHRSISHISKQVSELVKHHYLYTDNNKGGNGNVRKLFINKSKINGEMV